MEWVQVMVQSLGWIFGPLILVCGLAAVIACVRATRRGDPSTTRRAAAWSLSPIAAGLLGVAFGAGVVAANGPGAGSGSPAVHLGYTALFGVFVAVVPLVWLAALVWRRPVAAA